MKPIAKHMLMRIHTGGKSRSVGFHRLGFFRVRLDLLRRVAKQNDHLMDATRYFVTSGRDLMRIKPPDKPKQQLVYEVPGSGQRWMQ